MSGTICPYCDCALVAGSAPARGSGEADPLVSELRKLAATKYPLCQEARLLLEMAVDAQLGKPIDANRLLPNAPDQRPERENP